jgi:hypothetical protein
MALQVVEEALLLLSVATTLFTFTEEIVLVLLDAFPDTATLAFVVVELLVGEEIITTGAACAAIAKDANKKKAVKDFDIKMSLLKTL